jgi:hypothetical protein
MIVRRRSLSAPEERLAEPGASDAKGGSGLRGWDRFRTEARPQPAVAVSRWIPNRGKFKQGGCPNQESRDHRRGRHDHPFPRTFSRRLARQACIGVDSFKLKEKESGPLSVYNFCFCLPRLRAIEEYLSKPAPFSGFAYFYYTALSKNYRSGEDTRKVSVSAML